MLYGNNEHIIRSHPIDKLYKPEDLIRPLYILYKGLHCKIEFDPNGQPKLNLARKYFFSKTDMET